MCPQTITQLSTRPNDTFGKKSPFAEECKFAEMKTTQEDEHAMEDDAFTVYSNKAIIDTVEDYERNLAVFSSRKTYNLFDFLDNFLLCTFFSETTTKVFEDEESKKRKREKTTVKVLAMAFPRQENRDQDEYREFMNIDMLRQKSCIFVGEVNDSHQFKQGTMVTALKKVPIDTRFISIPSDFLISLPERLDPGEASALLSSYLPAFGALHHGSRDRDIRFSPTCFEGKSILLVGGDVIEQEALVKLAFMGAAYKVSVLPVWEYAPTVQAGRFRGSNLDVLKADPKVVLPLLKDSMDVVIDLSFPLHFASVKSTVKSTGRLVARKNDSNRHVSVSAVSNLIHQMTLFWMPNACLFDFECLSVNNNQELTRDMQFLFQLLSKRRIRPNVDKFITRNDVLDITEELRNKPVAGDVICELRCTDYMQDRSLCMMI